MKLNNAVVITMMFNIYHRDIIHSTVYVIMLPKKKAVATFLKFLPLFTRPASKSVNVYGEVEQSR